MSTIAKHFSPRTSLAAIGIRLRRLGLLDAIAEHVRQWLSWYRGPVGYEVRDLSVAGGDEAALCHYLYRVSGTMTNGRGVEMWVRSTVCFRKVEGAWVVAHEHTSVPFDAESGKASVNLKP